MLLPTPFLRIVCFLTTPPTHPSTTTERYVAYDHTQITGPLKSVKQSKHETKTKCFTRSVGKKCPPYGQYSYCMHRQNSLKTPDNNIKERSSEILVSTPKTRAKGLSVATVYPTNETNKKKTRSYFKQQAYPSCHPFMISSVLKERVCFSWRFYIILFDRV